MKAGVKQGISAIDSAASESDVGLLSREMRRIDRPMGGQKPVFVFRW